MNSSEIVNSGRSSGGRSSFSQTCSLLSQFLKEKGSFEDLSLSLGNNSETKGTMNLFPMIEKPGQNSGSGNLNVPLNIFPQHDAGGDETNKKPSLSGTKPEPETAPMTIFYAGQVIVFNNFPADKAQEIISIASKSSGAARNRHLNAAFFPPHAVQSPAESTTSTQSVVPPFGSLQPVLGSDLPIARKNSLARFLEKRKDRITANAPYQVNKLKASALKPAKAEPWLGLAHEFQMQRH